ncbi:restriction endonuclease subunit S [Enterococcus raffinosus]|uniref:restriction endonuclease subunit S n=1 Tax=Enterococcus raffinosus TaxID=71452 RepID=UPI00288D4560|nr:restriction endonuclease subunit S [Enterococcus raffinosus]MDT2554543.1 restriction endonuclease subunit S [Enterococcus raffinosus]
MIDTAELGSIAQITKLAGYEFTKHIDYIEDGEIIAIRALNIKNGQLELTDIKRISKGVSDSLVRSKLFKNDIILSYTGSKYGDVTIIPENDKYHLAPNVAKVTVNEEENPYFYYLLMTSIEFQWYLKNYGVGTGQPTIPMKNIRRIPVAHPSQDVQNKIVDIIKPINEKIVQNQEINHHLAEIAKSIFDSYFIDLSPYDGVMPDDWQLSNLTGIANYLNGLAMQKHRPQSNEQGLPVLKIKELRQGFTDSTSDLCSSNIRRDYIIHDGDVIFSWSGSLLVDFWTGGDCGLNQHLFKVSSETYDKWFYYAWTKHHLDRFVKMAADRATTMGHIKRDALEKAEVLIPSNKDYQEIGNKLKPIYDQIINNRVESRKLVALRDTLLPKLMSGEISATD